jgi:hypothetical protein
VKGIFVILVSIWTARFKDPETRQKLVFITNHQDLTPLTV